MNAYLAFAAACSVAICNGVAAILEKISTDKVSAHHAGSKMFVRLMGSWPYVIGVALDLLGWLLTLAAVRELPLFLVQAIIAANIVVTLLIERVLLHRILGRRVIVGIVVTLLGLFLLASAASPERAAAVSSIIRMSIYIAPLIIILISIPIAKVKSSFGLATLAVLSGVSFGATSVVGRILDFPSPLWHIAMDPLLWALVVYGVLGLILFTLALKNSDAATPNAIMTSAQTVVPALFGLAFLGDHIQHGLGYAVFLGITIVVAGTVTLSFEHNKPAQNHNKIISSKNSS